MTDAAADAADMCALQAGEGLALDRLMMRWQVPLRTFIFRHLGNEQDALDLAQETFVRIYRHCGRFRPDARFSTWMFQIALNLIRDHARRRTRRPTAPLDRAPELAAVDMPHTDAQSAEDVVAVREAIAALPRPLREAILLAEYENLSHAEIGRLVGATPKAVETRLYRAREHLRRQLRRWLES